MKTSMLIFLAVLFAALALTGTHTLAQGPLSPPGPPAPTMKTLSQVEPRIPISSAPYVISQPGSYYLTTNLASTGHGVQITTDNVTLDLNGFSITGERNSSTYGVYLAGAGNAPLKNIMVRNGIIANFGTGVRIECALNSRIEGLCISSNFFYGLLLFGYFGQCDGNSIVNCSISGNGSVGVCLLASSGQCNGNSIARCVIRNNVDYGIYLLDAHGNRVEENHITDTTGSSSYGIYSSSFGSQNLILRNTCVGQTNNFDLSVNDTYGPIVTDSGQLATSGAAAHPWANFSR